MAVCGFRQNPVNHHAFLFANQGNGGNDHGTGTPQITADPQKIDYGYVKSGNDETFTIKVTNKRDGVLRFKEKTVY